MKKFISSILGDKRKLSIAIIVIIAAALPLTVFVAQKQQEIRQRAAGEQTALFFSKGTGCSNPVTTTSFLPGQTLTLNLCLNTNNTGVNIVNGFDITIAKDSGVTFTGIADGVDGAKITQTAFNTVKSDGSIRFSKVDTNNTISGTALHLGTITLTTASTGTGNISITLAQIVSPSSTITALSVSKPILSYTISQQATCGTGETQCGTSCVNTLIDTNNCGGCAKVCSSGKQCSNAVCVASTPKAPPCFIPASILSQLNLPASTVRGYGDVDLDGDVDANDDALLSLRFVAGLDIPSPVQIEAGDVDSQWGVLSQKDSLTAVDALMVQRYLQDLPIPPQYNPPNSNTISLPVCLGQPAPEGGGSITVDSLTCGLTGVIANISWTAKAGETSYIVYHKKSTDSTWTYDGSTSGNIPITSDSLGSLSKNTNYDFKINLGSDGSTWVTKTVNTGDPCSGGPTPAPTLTLAPTPDGGTGGLSISGVAFIDSNRNQVKDSGEAGFPNLEVGLLKGTSGPFTWRVNTNTLGGYSFSNLSSGTYMVDVVEAPSGYTLSPSRVSRVDLVSSSVTKDFALIPDAATATPTPTTGVHPTATPVPTSVPGTTQIALKIGLDSIGSVGDSTNPDPSASTKNPVHTTRNVTVELYNSSESLVSKFDGTVQYNSTTGIFTGTVLLGQTAGGNYIVKIRSLGYLRRRLPGITALVSGQTYNANQVNLVTGDLNGDNRMDIADYNILNDCIFAPASTHGTVCSQNPDYATMSDLNDNGIKNILDYSLFVRELIVRDGD